MNLNKRVGLFSFITIICFLGVLFIGGTFKFYQSHHFIETYFDESVKGLSVGQSVKYRGVKIGTITNIDFVSNVYPQDDITKSFIVHPYVYVKMSIYFPSFDQQKDKPFKKVIAELVNNGLRISISPEGITGGASLELDFINPKLSADNKIKINWIPNSPYIPSNKSTLAQLGDLFSVIHDAAKKLDTEQISNSITNSLRKFTDMSGQANELLIDLNMNPSQFLFTSAPKKQLKG